MKKKTLRDRADAASGNLNHEDCWLAGYRAGRRSGPTLAKVLAAVEVVYQRNRGIKNWSISDEYRDAIREAWRGK